MKMLHGSSCWGFSVMMTISYIYCIKSAMLIDNYREHILLLLFVGWACFKVSSTLQQHKVPTYCTSINQTLHDCIACLQLDFYTPKMHFKLEAPTQSVAPQSGPPSLQDSAMAYLIEQKRCAPYVCSDLLDENDFWLTSAENMKLIDQYGFKVTEKPIEFKYVGGTFKKYTVGKDIKAINVRYRLSSNQTDSQVVVVYPRENHLDRVFVGTLGIIVPGLQLVYLLICLPKIGILIMCMMLYDSVCELPIPQAKLFAYATAIIYFFGDLYRQTSPNFYIRTSIIIIFAIFLNSQSFHSTIILVTMIMAITYEQEFLDFSLMEAVMIVNYYLVRLERYSKNNVDFTKTHNPLPSEEL